ncbi:sugar phosphate isomerase/epimerase family protein [Flavilitoribacter nigricans]|uniref:Sugar phosphate isomerase n=1 Tax=Flavilitoribacter nigricans (strain ATCC 23147 / DSM 23189 / NBRC 102662 / NCIMB 1420 / SS-2) TaxID=1122177 RepID=A0A2D0N0S8_FLAN2|nr:sugar phosphate isomerase/epimerase family protein [Flavilitoribacter nigricans]PHN01749.1 sugar phosphate isomerase [Flavilitoribacter nigricans DSM 23189 = NBRC 102662]
MNDSLSFAVSTWLWTSPFTNDTIGLFPKIKSMGYDAVEIPVEDPGLIDNKLIKQALADHGLRGIVCGAFGPSRDLTNEDPGVHQQCFDYIQECFELCNELGAKFLAGPMYSAVGKARMVSPEQRKQEWDLAVNNLYKVCEIAASRELSVALEPLNRFESDMVNTAEDVARLVRDINHPAAKILLDSFHMTIEERDIEQAFLTAGDKLIHVQVSENYRGTPGTGLTPWGALKSGLEKINYRGTISIESFTPEIKELAGAVCIWKNLADNQDDFASDGLQFLKQLFN